MISVKNAFNYRKQWKIVMFYLGSNLQYNCSVGVSILVLTAWKIFATNKYFSSISMFTHQTLNSNTKQDVIMLGQL